MLGMRRKGGCHRAGTPIEPGMDVPEAVAYLTGRPLPSGGYSKSSKSSKPPAANPTRSSLATAARPSVRADRRGRRAHHEGIAPADALALVDEAAVRLWTPKGRAALAYLEGRGLTAETIRRHRLGMDASGDAADLGRSSILASERNRHPLAGWRPPDVGQDPPARRPGTKVCPSVCGPAKIISRPRRDPGRCAAGDR